MAELSEDQKRELTTMLAHFYAPAEVQKHFRAEHQLDLTIRHIIVYDATSIYFEAGERYRELFEQAREAYITQVSTIPIANQGYRLNVLNRMAQDALKKGNHVLAAQLLRQSAEEVGGALTNERKVTKVDDLDLDEKRRLARDILVDAIGRVKGEAPGTASVQ